MDATTSNRSQGNGKAFQHLRQTAESNVIHAAKVVVALSGWGKRTDGREVYQTSYMAVEVLRAAIQEAENPVLQLAPEPLPPGL